jgi:hypothetical protein
LSGIALSLPLAAGSVRLTCLAGQLRLDGMLGSGRHLLDELDQTETILHGETVEPSAGVGRVRSEKGALEAANQKRRFLLSAL